MREERQVKYEFDRIIDRRGTGSLKYDCAAQRGRPEDALPLWVADMDFAAPPEVCRALEERSAHGIFGYSEPMAGYFPALRAWLEGRFDWRVEEEWLIKTPGVVFALCMAIQAYTQPGEGVLIQPPVYYPFEQSVRDNGRRVVACPLVWRAGRYEMDFAAMERAMEEEGVRLFLLCSPHNPVGRVWTREELTRVGEMCLRHGVKIVSDEIHFDFVWPGHRHTVFATLGEELAQNCVVCTAPSKTFNLAGLQVSNIFIPNGEMRRAFQHRVDAAGYSQLGAMGLLACQRAYETGEEWLEQLKGYLLDNIALVRRFVDQRLAPIRLIEPEGTYLLWLDFRGLGMSEEQREEFLLHRAHLWLDSGAMFGPAGEGFERLNIACPRPVLERALEQLAQALEQHQSGM